jgi:hypothetical protein
MEWIHHSKRDEGNLTKFNMEKAGNIFVSVNQVNPRTCDKSSGYAIGKTRLIIARLNEDENLDYLSHKYDQCNHNTELELDLAPGQYVVWSQIEYRTPRYISTYTLSIYSSTKNTFPETFEYPGAFNAILTSAGSNKNRIKSDLRF